MYKGLICYDKKRYSKNIFFANELKNFLIEKNIETEICFTENIDIYNGINFVIMRTYKEGLSKNLENRNIRVFNCSKVSEICNDKHKTYKFFDSLGLNYLPYKLISTKNYQTEQLIFPLIIKSRFGHGGNEVFLVNNIKDIGKVFAKCGDDTLIAQKAAKTLGKDKRVYVLGGKIFVGVLRTSSMDFRSNFSLGGNAALCEITDEEKNIVGKIVENLKIDFAGIDFIYDGDKPLLNEIEDIVGCRMLYKFNINAAKTYVNYVLEILKGI